MQGSVDWLLKSQTKNGCFQKQGYTHSSYLKGGNSDSSLTPFILTALLKAKARLGVNITMNQLEEGVDCMLDVYNSSDLYSTIVTAYAATLITLEVNKKSKMFAELENKVGTWEKKLRTILNALEAKANTKVPGAKFWDIESDKSKWGYYSRSNSVEMTAYMVLIRSLKGELGSVVDSVKWLTKQRNSRGGFVSTQDTVVGLQALSTYAQKANR